jgi:hypothetical protein
MDHVLQIAQDKLNLTPRSHQELQGVLTSFEQKWQNKARYYRSGHRAFWL